MGPKNNSGMTLIEVIGAMLIIGIVVAVVVSKTTSTSTYDLVAEFETLKSHMRYAQLRAMSDSDTWGIRFESGSYTLQQDGTDTSFFLPSENSAAHTFASGVTKSAGDTTITSDDWGSPGASNKTITLSAGGSSRTITVTKNTGFIP